MLNKSKTSLSLLVLAALMLSSCDQKANKIKGSGGLAGGLAASEKKSKANPSSEKLLDKEGLSGINSMALELDTHLLETLPEVIEVLKYFEQHESKSLRTEWRVDDRSSSQENGAKGFVLRRTFAQPIADKQTLSVDQILQFSYKDHSDGPLKTQGLQVIASKKKDVYASKDKILFKSNYVHQMTFTHLKNHNAYSVQLVIKEHVFEIPLAKDSDVISFEDGSEFTFDVALLDNKSYSITNLKSKLKVTANKTPVTPNISMGYNDTYNVAFSKTGATLMADNISLGDSKKMVKAKIINNKLVFEKSSLDLTPTTETQETSFEKLYRALQKT